MEPLGAVQCRFPLGIVLWLPQASCGKGQVGQAAQASLCSNPGCLSQLPNFIVKVLSTICFIWATSEHYNTPSRVIVILREFSNQIIEMVTAIPSLGSPTPILPDPSWSQAWGSP